MQAKLEQCALHKGMVHMTSHLHRVHREMQLVRKCWIPLKEAQLESVAGSVNLSVDDLFGTNGTGMEQGVQA